MAKSHKPTSIFRLQIDDREHIDRKIYDTIYGKHFVEIEFKRLGTGDYAISKDGVLMLIIERKTWKDLAASIVDLRLESQLEALDGYKAKGVRVMLLIEGTRREHRSITIDQMETKLDRVMLRNQIPVVFTKSEEDTARRIFQLIDHFPPELELVQAQAQVAELGGQAIPLERKDKSTDLVVTECLCRLKDVSAQSAQLLMQRYSLQDLTEGKAQIADIEAMVYPSGNRIGHARAQRIIDQCRSQEGVAKMLSGISGVTEETGMLIVSGGKYGRDDIANIMKGKRRLGGKIADKIITVWRHRLAQDVKH